MYLAHSPEFSCEYPATLTKPTRCARLKDKCVPVSSVLTCLVLRLLFVLLMSNDRLSDFWDSSSTLGSRVFLFKRKYLLRARVWWANQNSENGLKSNLHPRGSSTCCCKWLPSWLMFWLLCRRRNCATPVESEREMTHNKVRRYHGYRRFQLLTFPS
jgi:hypothetical protein